MDLCYNITGEALFELFEWLKLFIKFREKKWCRRHFSVREHAESNRNQSNWIQSDREDISIVLGIGSFFSRTSGNISVFANTPNATHIMVGITQVTGKNSPLLYLNMRKTPYLFQGDITVFASTPKLEDVELVETEVTGKVCLISNKFNFISPTILRRYFGVWEHAEGNVHQRWEQQSHR